MRAMLLTHVQSITEGQDPLVAAEIAKPSPGADEVLIRVSACGVCHTELDEIEGRTPPPAFPVVLGHQVLGVIEATGPGVSQFRSGDRVGAAWIFSACGHCHYCVSGRENLCPSFRATGRDAHGGYAEYMVAPAAFIYPIPEALTDLEAAPLLCAGAIGYRSLRLTNLPKNGNLGLTGFGASGHLVMKMMKHIYPEASVYVFARSPRERAFALELGAAWAGDTSDTAPVALDAIIDTTPAWHPVVEALRNLAPGGRLVINAIRKQPEDQTSLLGIDYPTHLWMEKEIVSVANVTRRDVSEFLELAAENPIHPEVQSYPLEAANTALKDLKAGRVRGAKVLSVS